MGAVAERLARGKAAAAKRQLPPRLDAIAVWTEELDAFDEIGAVLQDPHFASTVQFAIRSGGCHLLASVDSIVLGVKYY